MSLMPGEQAWELGKPLSACPHPIDSDEGRLWCKQWIICEALERLLEQTRVVVGERAPNRVLLIHNIKGQKQKITSTYMMLRAITPHDPTTYPSTIP